MSASIRIWHAPFSALTFSKISAISFKIDSDSRFCSSYMKYLQPHNPGNKEAKLKPAFERFFWKQGMASKVGRCGSQHRHGSSELKAGGRRQCV